jgi:hypothetical protein
MNTRGPSEKPLLSAQEDDRSDRFYLISIPDNPRPGRKPVDDADIDDILDYIADSSRICKLCIAKLFSRNISESEVIL